MYKSYTNNYTHGVLQEKYYLEFINTLPYNTSCYVDDGILKQRPKRPSEFHLWDPINKYWVEVLNEKLDYYSNINRAQRDNLLSQLDQVVMNPFRWNALTPGQQEEYGIYRQALLDVPQQQGFPLDIVWPTKPQGL